MGKQQGSVEWLRKLESLKKLPLAKVQAMAAKVLEIEFTRFALNESSAFFSTTLFRLNKVSDPKLGTIATDGKSFFYDPYFVCSFPSMFAGAYHEILHIVCDHFSRQHKESIWIVDSKGNKVSLWNLACDLQINWMLYRAIPQLPIDLMSYTFEGITPDEHTTAEEIYELLKKKLQGKMKNAVTIYVDSLGEYLGDDGQNFQDKHMDFDGSVKPQVQSDIARASVMGAGIGKLPGCIGKLIDGILHPRLDYKHLLAQFVLEQNRCDWKMNPWNKRIMRLRGLACPKLRGQTLRINVAIDTSGSTGEFQQQFLGELRGILSVADEYRATIIYCDSAIPAKGGVVEITKTDPIPPTNYSGGGCLAAGAEVLTPQGYRCIENISKGDKVFAHDGKIRKVLETFVNKGDSRECYEINTCLGQPIILTENHPLYVLKPRGCKYDRSVSCVPGRNSKYCKQCFTPQKPRFLGWKPISEIAKEQNTYGWYAPLPKLPGNEGTYNEGYLDGWVIGDGYVEKHRRDRVSIYLTASKTIPPKLNSILKNYRITSRIKDNTLELKILDKKLSCQMFDLKYKRKILKQIMRSGESFCKGFLQGLLESDGYKQVGFGRIQLSNKFFIDCAAIACYKSGYLFSITSVDNHRGGNFNGRKIVNSKPAWLIQISDPSKTGSRCYRSENMLYVKLQKINKVKNPGTTYNLKVEKTESYLLRHVGSHNTDFRPVFKWIKEHNQEAYGLVYLTDGYGPYPENDMGISTLWVLTKDSDTPPFGRQAKIDL